MKYPLQDLLRVRVVRKDKATEEVLKAQRAVAEAMQFLEKKRQELEEFKQWRIDEIDRLYRCIMMKDIRKNAVDDLNFDLANLDNKLLEYRKRVDDATSAVRAAELVLHERQVVLQLKMRELQKIEEHKEIWVKEDKLLEESLQEKELEEFRVKDPDQESQEAYANI